MLRNAGKILHHIRLAGIKFWHIVDKRKGKIIPPLRRMGLRIDRPAVHAKPVVVAGLRSLFQHILPERALCPAMIKYRIDHHAKSERMRLLNQRLQFFLRADIRLHAVVVDRVVPVVGIRPQNRI